MPFQDTNGVHKRKFIGVSIHTDGGFMHERPDGKVKHQQSVKFLPHQIWRLTAEYNLRATQVNLELVQGILHFPALVIQRG